MGGVHTMRAAVLRQVDSPLVIEEIPIPEVGPDDVLMKVKQCGVCSSDVSIASGAKPVGPLPFIMGHEGVGIVEGFGERVTRFRNGDRVLMNPLVSCGMCAHCSVGRDNICENHRLIGISPGTQGVYAEYGVIPERNLFRLPDRVSFTDGVITTSLLSCAFHGVRRVDFRASETACIYGVGAIGTLLILVLRAFGASLVVGVDVNRRSLENAAGFGPDALIDATTEDPVESIKEMTGGRGVDVGFEAAGDHEAIWQAISSTRKGGRTCSLGVPFYHVVMDFKERLGFFREICEKEASVIYSWAYCRQEFPMMLTMVNKGLIDFSPCRTKSIPLEWVNEGLRLNKTGGYTRVFIEF